jgi:DNA-binding MarR family transcriptional regulator
MAISLMSERQESNMSQRTNTKVEDLAAKASVLILSVREEIYAGLASLLKSHQVTEPQFNVLRILRGAGPVGLSCHEVGNRMITRIPDVTRLLDRLESQNLIVRARDEADRRVVMARLTRKGKSLLSRLDEPVQQYHETFMKPLGKGEILEIIRLMRKIQKG